ncbi:MAG: hypothetical protein ACLPKB_06595 [Xanthobacteraceae bacterium]
MRMHVTFIVASIVLALVSIARPAAADTNINVQNYPAKCKAASFARRGPGVMSTAMRNAEIQRCIKNRGVLD